MTVAAMMMMMMVMVKAVVVLKMVRRVVEKESVMKMKDFRGGNGAAKKLERARNDIAIIGTRMISVRIVGDGTVRQAVNEAALDMAIHEGEVRIGIQRRTKRNEPTVVNVVFGRYLFVSCLEISGSRNCYFRVGKE